MATPQVMFEPARLWTGWRPSAASTAAIIPAVVVLPLVALTIVEPPSRRGAEPGDRVRREAQQHPAGQRRAAAAPAGPAGGADRPRQRELGAEKPALKPAAGGRDEHAERARQHPQRGRQVGQVLAVGVDGEGPAGAQLEVRGAEDADLVLLDVGALEHLRQVTHEAQLADLADRDDVELAVVELGVGGDVHAAAEGLLLATETE